MIDARSFRDAVGRFATGVTVVTTVLDGIQHAMTANSFTSVSLDPVLVLVSVDRSARFHDVVVEAGVFGVTVLSAAQEATARWFADRGRPRDDTQFADHPYAIGPATGVALLQGALATLECRVHAVHEAGDHSLVVGEVAALTTAPAGADPLVFYAGSYGSLGW